MELFDKIYGCYYHIIRRMLNQAADHPLTRQDMEDICRTLGFQESALAILPKIKDGTWPLFQENGLRTYTSRLHTPPCPLPLTSLQKAWLRSLLSDPRIHLFLDETEQAGLEQLLADTQPLYNERDFYYFDRYKDGDPYDSPEYREHFHIILTALREHRILLTAYEGKKGRTHTFEVLPYQLQYSSKDDKFRLCCLRHSRGRFCRNTLLNLSRIKHCRLSLSLTAYIHLNHSVLSLCRKPRNQSFLKSAASATPWSGACSTLPTMKSTRNMTRTANAGSAPFTMTWQMKQNFLSTSFPSARWYRYWGQNPLCGRCGTGW